jgi:hypothetical protein
MWDFRDSLTLCNALQILADILAEISALAETLVDMSSVLVRGDWNSNWATCRRDTRFDTRARCRGDTPFDTPFERGAWLDIVSDVFASVVPVTLRERLFV